MIEIFLGIINLSTINDMIGNDIYAIVMPIKNGVNAELTQYKKRTSAKIKIFSAYFFRNFTIHTILAIKP